MHLGEGSPRLSTTVNLLAGIGAWPRVWGLATADKPLMRIETHSTRSSGADRHLA